MFGHTGNLAKVYPASHPMTTVIEALAPPHNPALGLEREWVVD